jgi:hypothetical protein
MSQRYDNKQFAPIDGGSFKYGKGWRNGEYDVMRLDIDERFEYLECLGQTLSSCASPIELLRSCSGMNLTIRKEEELDNLSRYLKRKDGFDYRKTPNDTSVDLYYRPREAKHEEWYVENVRVRIRNPNFSFYHVNLLPALGPVEGKKVIGGMLPGCIVRVRKSPVADAHIMFRTSNYIAYQNIGLLLSNERIPYYPSFRQLLRGRGNRKTKLSNIYSFTFYTPSVLRRYVDREAFPSTFGILEGAKDLNPEETIRYISKIERMSFIKNAKDMGRFGRNCRTELYDMRNKLTKKITMLDREIDGLEEQKGSGVPDLGKKLKSLKASRDSTGRALDNVEDMISDIPERKRKKDSFSGRRHYMKERYKDMRAQDLYDQSKKT